jgi:hypothetical protein
LWKGVGLLAAAAAILGAVAYWQYQRQKAGNESQRRDLADQRYKDHNFEDAAARYASLDRDFPDSPERSLYRFAAELSGLREPVYRAQNDPDEVQGAFQRLRDFVAGARGDPLLDRYQADLWDTFYHLYGQLADAAEQKHDRGLLILAQKALEEAGTFKPSVETPAQAKIDEARARLAKIDQAVTTWQHKEAVLARLKGVVGNFSVSGMHQAAAEAKAKGLEAEPDVAKLLAELPAAHQASVRYTPAPAAMAEQPVAEDLEPNMLIAPLLTPRPPATSSKAPVVLGQARGVLYAFEPGRGDVGWATRVSIDAQSLPLHLSRTASSPELVLALTPDNSTLTALEADRGTVVWRQRLKGACLGDPVLVGKRIFVATDRGHVEEIDAAVGKLLGSYNLGEPLVVGGVQQPWTQLVYFPADSHSVYVLDVARRQCAGILYTGHPAGSLRCAPVILPDPLPAQGQRLPRGHLVLSQEDGLDKVKLRAFPVPISGHEARARTGDSAPLTGWSWFPPHVYAEWLAQVTDTGHFALLGIEPRTGFFPGVSGEVVLGSRSASSERSQIVHADAQHFWALADGTLYKLLRTFDRMTGPALLHVPLSFDPLGSALHGSQVRTDPAGKTTLYLVTETRDGLRCLVSALDARLGTPAWQRQLGLHCLGTPVSLGTQLLVQDLDRTIYRFNMGAMKPDSASWHIAAPARTAPLANQVGPALLLPGRDSRSIYVIRTTGPQPALVVQLFKEDGDEPETKEYRQQAPLAGTPALSADALVLALANGVLARQALAGGPAVAGPNWRASHLDPDTRAFVVSLGGDDFLVTDGSGGLKRLRWPAGNMAETTASAELPSRIIAPPEVLPPAPGGQLQVCVADAANSITLFQADTLRTIRQWPMNGRITAGPFRRGKGICCIVERRRLVWLDPAREQSWEYAFAADVVGEPQLIRDDLLVVADLSGHFSGFNPATGHLAGPGYTLRANVAAAAAPVPFGRDRLFAPLTDGTVMLLSQSHFRHPMLGMPSVW